MATTLPNTGAVIPAMTDPADQEVNNAAFTAIDTKIGGLIESGSNANGSYIKFDDGTLICSYVTYEITGLSVADGSAHALNSFPYPAQPVSSIQTVSISAYIADSSSNRLYIPIFTHGGANAWINPHFKNQSGVTVTKVMYLSLFAIGRWK